MRGRRKLSAKKACAAERAAAADDAGPMHDAYSGGMSAAKKKTDAGEKESEGKVLFCDRAGNEHARVQRPMHNGPPLVRIGGPEERENEKSGMFPKKKENGSRCFAAGTCRPAGHFFQSHRLLDMRQKRRKKKNY